MYAKPFDLDRLLDLWSAPIGAGDAAVEAFGEFYTDPVTLNGARSSVADLVARARDLERGLADVEREVLDVADAGRKLAVAFRLSGRHVGPMKSAVGIVAPTGRRLTLRVIDILTLTDGGKVSDVVMVADELGAYAGTGSVVVAD